MISAALARVEEELTTGEFAFAPTDEDIHTAIERRVTEIAGPTGAKLHTGRSRNDQVALDLRLFLRREGRVQADAHPRPPDRAPATRRGSHRRLSARLHAPPAGATGAARASPPRALLGARP